MYMYKKRVHHIQSSEHCSRSIRAWLKTYFDGIYASISGTVSTVYKEATYAILDADGYARIECNTTDGAVTITLPLMANNLGRRIEIALVNNDASADVVTVSPHATDANKLSRDLLATIILSKLGDYIVVQQSSNSGCWEIVDEKITSQLWLNTYAGYGDTDKKIPYFSTVVENVGNTHTLTTNNSTNGAVVTINKSGRYGIALVFGGDVSTRAGGISLNATGELSTTILSVTAAKIIAISSVYASSIDMMSVQIYLKKGDVIRPHTEGVAPTRTTDCKLILTYLG